MMFQRVILILLVLFLSSCSNNINTEIMIEEKKKLQERADKNCPLFEMDHSQDFLVAQIYFETSQSKLSEKDIDIIRRISDLYFECPYDILIIGHSSKMETANNIVEGTKLSLQRVINIKNEISKNAVLDQYINMLFCGNSSNMVLENSDDNSSLFNQRVDIVFLNTPFDQHRFDCISK